MGKIILALTLMLLSACALVPSPQVTAYREYVAANHSRAEQGAISWSNYYEGLYSHALAAGAPADYLSRVIEMIGAAKKYEKGEMTADEFAQARRIAQTGAVASAQAAEERERQRRMAAASAFAGAMNASANQTQATTPTYQIVQPTPLPRTTYTNCSAFGNQLNCTTR